MSRFEPPAYLERLESFLRPLQHSQYYQACWQGYTDTGRFEGYLRSAAKYYPLEGAAILDLGAGTGGLLLACQQYGANCLVGVEVNPVLHELARLRLADTGIESLLTDGLHVPLRDASFDVILSIHVIEHTQSPSRYLAQIARLVKPQGIVLLACPNRLWPIEPHGNIPFVTYLPFALSRRLCLWRSRSPRVPPAVRQQYHTATLLEQYISFLGLRRLCRSVDLEFVEVNSPSGFRGVEIVSLGAWGRAHPRIERTMNTVNRRLINDRIVTYVRSNPLSHIAHWLAILLNWETTAILRKRSA